MKLFYTYDEFESDARTLAKSLKNEGFDAIIGVARGGFFLAARLAYLLGIRQLHSVSVTQYKGSKLLAREATGYLHEREGMKRIVVAWVEAGDELLARPYRVDILLAGKLLVGHAVETQHVDG